MNFDVNRPTTTAQLAALYLGNPNQTPAQVDSNLFINSAQSRDYIHQQGKNLGIGDPAAYFGQMQLAQRMASTPNGAQMEAQRLARMPAPDANLASLQTANRMKAYPLPAAGMSPNLSPVMQADMAQQGISNPMEYLMAKRLGPNRNAVASIAGLQGAVNPDALYNQPTFQNAMGQNAGTSANVFQALTGRDLATYDTQYRTSADQERKRGIEFLSKAMQDGHARPMQGGGMEWSERVFDPNTSKMTPTGKFIKGDAYQSSQEKYLPHVDRDIAKFQALEAARGSTPVAPVASLQNPYSSDQGVPLQLAAGGAPNSSGMSVFGDTMAGIIGDAKRVFTGGEQAWLGGTGETEAARRQWGRGAGDFLPPSGRNIRHARPLLANNPQFQALMRRDPEAARRIILTLQYGDTSPQAAPLQGNTDPVGF